MKRLCSELPFLLLPTIYLSGLIICDVQNWGSGLYGEFIKFFTRAQNFYWVDGLYPFGYPLFLRGLFFFTKDYLLAAKILSLVSSFMILYCVAKITAVLFTNRAGILSQLVLFVSPVFFKYSFLEGTDIPSVALFFISLWFVLKEGDERGSKNLVLSGLFMGFAYLIRYTNMLFAILIVLWLMFSGRNMKSNLRQTVVFLSCFLLGSSPQLIASVIKTGNPFYNTQIQNIYFGVYGQKDWISHFGSYNGTLIQLLKEDFPGFIRHTIHELWQGIKILNRLLVPAFFGFLLFFFKMDIEIQVKKKAILIFVFSICFLMGISTSFVADRLLLPMYPLLCIPVAFFLDIGLGHLDLILKKFLKTNRLNYICLLFSGVVVLIYMQKVIKFDVPSVHLNREISDVLLNNGMESTQDVLCSSSGFHYSGNLERYSNFWWGKHIFKKDISFKEFENVVLTERYQFVIFEENEGLSHLPNLEILFMEDRLPDWWKLIFKRFQRIRVVAYKIDYGIWQDGLPTSVDEETYSFYLMMFKTMPSKIKYDLIRGLEFFWNGSATSYLISLSEGTYEFFITAKGTPALGENAMMMIDILKVFNMGETSVFVQEFEVTEKFEEHDLEPIDLEEGNYRVKVSFLNDLTVKKEEIQEDRNLFIKDIILNKAEFPSSSGRR